MVNQQLREYVSEQLRVGVSRDAIKNALLEAGWMSADVSEALGVASPRMDAVMPKVTMVSKPQMSSAQPAISIPAARVVTAPKTIDAKPSFIGAPTQRPAAMPMGGSKPISFADAVTNPHPAMKLSLAHRVAHLVMGVAILALGATGTWLFLKNIDLAQQFGMLANDKASMAAELGTLKTERGNFQAHIDTLRSENEGLTQALGIFVAPSGTVGATQDIAAEGILSLGTGALPYTLAMKAGITLTLRNSHDAAVEQVLKPLVGSDISILARHTIGSKDVTVLQVNGATIK